MWFKDFFLYKLVPTFLNIIPALFGGLYESGGLYEIISLPLVICFVWGVIIIVGKAIEYTQEIAGRIKNKRHIKEIERRNKK